MSAGSDKESIPEVPYQPPEWAGVPQDPVWFEVIKNGSIIEETEKTSKSFLVAGRLPFCDLSMEHASISRFHAIIQAKSDGSLYIYDLGSSHGTTLNKTPLPPKKYIRLHNGDMIRFGHSSRIYIVQGGGEINQPSDPNALVTNQGQQKQSTDENQEDEDGVSWGFQQDAYEGDDLGAQQEIDVSNIDLSEIDSNVYYYNDPKKALRVWCEARGMEYEITFSEDQQGSIRDHAAQIVLPVSTAGGFLTAVGNGSKKAQAERLACLEICYKLDKLGLLRQGSSQARSSLKRQIDLARDADADVDEFFDRTEKTPRKKQNVDKKTKTESLDSLLAQKKEILERLEMFNTELENIEAKSSSGEGGEEDALDQFMSSVNRNLDSEAGAKLRKKIAEATNELARIDKFIKVAAPGRETEVVHVPSSRVPSHSESKSQDSDKSGLSNPSPGLASPVEFERKSVAFAEPERVQRERKKTPSAPAPFKPKSKLNVYATEELEEWVPPEDKKVQEQANSLNSSYGY